MKQAGVPKLDLLFSTCRCLRLTSLLPVHVQSACVVARFFWPPTSEIPPLFCTVSRLRRGMFFFPFFFCLSKAKHTMISLVSFFWLLDCRRIGGAEKCGMTGVGTRCSGPGS